MAPIDELKRTVKQSLLKKTMHCPDICLETKWRDNENLRIAQFSGPDSIRDHPKCNCRNLIPGGVKDVPVSMRSIPALRSN
jgi:hypothetical protein